MPTVRLLPYRKEFLALFLAWRRQPSMVRHNPLQPMTAEELEHMLESAGSDLSDLRKHQTFRWFVEYEGSVVGSVSLKNISHSMGYGEIGYGISETHHNRGIGTTAVSELVRKVFIETPLRKLLAFVHDANHASCKLLDKVGFQQEGFLREHYVINGQPANEILYGLVKRDWADF
jgi:RimJ/RimL family protein N-acetyltransferase